MKIFCSALLFFGIVYGSAVTLAQVYALVQADDYGLENIQNIGAMIYYGPGTGVSEREVCELIKSRLGELGVARNMIIQPEGFFAFDKTPGIAVGYHVGGVSVDKVGVRAAVKKKHLTSVMDKRQLTVQLLSEQTVNSTLSKCSPFRPSRQAKARNLLIVGA